MDIVVKYYEGEIRKKDEEVDYWKRKFFVLQTQCVFQKEELDAYKVKLDALSMELQEKKLDSYLVENKLKDLTNVVSTTESDELKYNTMCDKLKEQIEELKTMCQESTAQAELKLKCEVDLERQLKDCRTQCSEMYEELKRYKMTCDQLNVQNEAFKSRCKELATQAESGLAKQVDLEKHLSDYKAKYSETYEELNRYKMKCGEAGKCIDKLSKEIVHLGDEKRKLEDKSEVLKTKIRELESKKTLYLKELDGYKVKCHGLKVELKEKQMDFVEYKRKLKKLSLTTNAFVDELEGYKTALDGLKEQIKGLAEDRKSFSKREKKAEERIAYLQEVVKSKLYSPPHVDRDEHVSGSVSTTKQSEHLVKLAGDMGNAASLFKMEFANRANEKTNFEIEEREIAVFNQDNLQPGGIVQMGSNGDDRDTRPKHTCDAGRLNVSTADTVERSSNCTSSERPFFDQKGEECGIKCKAVDIPLSSAPKRKRLPETVTSDSNEDNPTPICKLKGEET